MVETGSPSTRRQQRVLQAPNAFFRSRARSVFQRSKRVLCKLNPLTPLENATCAAPKRPSPRTARKRAAASLLSLFLLPLLLASPPALSPSPLDLHREFRVKFLARKPAAEQIQAIVDRIGDHSYDSLLRFRPATAAGLRLERQAMKAWDDGQPDEALRKYRGAFEIFEADGARSESAFCLYYMAEILSAREQYDQALVLLDQAELRAVGCIYLGALIADSRGYCLWFQDRLPASTQSFSRASGFWQRLDFADGTVLCWNNLALLCEEMGLARKASEYYRQSLANADPCRASPEILFYLYSNFATFLLGSDDSRGAREYLARAEALGSVSPDELSLLRCRVEGVESRLADLALLPDDLPSIRIEKLLLLGERAAATGDRSATDLYRQAFQLSRTSGLRRDTRKCLLRLCRWLESRGEFHEAANLYLAGFQAEESMHAPELFFPYSRTVSPLFDGWIRSLVGTGSTWQALQSIQRVSELRRTKARAIIRTTPTALAPRTPLDAFAQVAVLEDQAGTSPAASVTWELQDETEPDSAWTDPRLRGTADTILELWPDGNTVYVWGRGPGGYFFRSCHLPAPCTELIDRIVASLYGASSSLPPPPTNSVLQTLYRSLWKPMESHMGGPAVLLIPHKELQNLPFEMLRDSEGNWLAERFDFSYLPSLPSDSGSQKADGAPAAIVPSGVAGVSTAADERAFFGLLVPDVSVRSRLELDASERPSWVHVSGHMRLDDNFWGASTLEDEAGQLNVFRFLKKARNCALVSLGVCDAGNGYSSQSPYWLGFTELFLSHGVDALVVNRWRMDDLSSSIYMDFYRLALAGVPMDSALGRARRNFLRRALRRGATTIAGNNPFFWAGVTYVGLPGQRLYPAQHPGPALLLIDGLLLGGAIVALARWRWKDLKDRKDFNDLKEKTSN